MSGAHYEEAIIDGVAQGSEIPENPDRDDTEPGEAPEYSQTPERGAELPQPTEITRENEPKTEDEENAVSQARKAVVETHGGNEEDWKAGFEDNTFRFDREKREMFDQDGNSFTQWIRENESLEKIAAHEKILDHFFQNPNEVHICEEKQEQTDEGIILHVPTMLLGKDGVINYRDMEHLIEKEELKQEDPEELIPEGQADPTDFTADGELPELVDEIGNLEINLNERFMNSFAAIEPVAETEIVIPETISVEPAEEIGALPLVNDAIATSVSREIFTDTKIDAEESQAKNAENETIGNEVMPEIVIAEKRNESEMAAQTIAQDRGRENEVIDLAPVETVVMAPEKITTLEEEIKMDTQEGVFSENVPGEEAVHESPTLEVSPSIKPQEIQKAAELHETSPTIDEREASLPDMAIAETPIAMNDAVHEGDVNTSESVINTNSQHETSSIEPGEVALADKSFVITKGANSVREAEPQDIEQTMSSGFEIREKKEVTQEIVTEITPKNETVNEGGKAETETTPDADATIQKPEEAKMEVAADVSAKAVKEANAPRAEISRNIKEEPIAEKTREKEAITPAKDERSSDAKETSREAINGAQENTGDKDRDEVSPPESSEIKFEMDAAQEPVQEKDEDHINPPQRMTGREILLRSLGITPRRGNLFESATPFRASVSSTASTQTATDQSRTPRRQGSNAFSSNGITLERAA